MVSPLATAFKVTSRKIDKSGLLEMIINRNEYVIIPTGLVLTDENRKKNTHPQNGFSNTRRCHDNEVFEKKRNFIVQTFK